MKSNVKRTIVLTCLVSLVVASLAVAEYERDYNRCPQCGQARYRQGDRQGRTGMGGEGRFRDEEGMRSRNETRSRRGQGEYGGGEGMRQEGQRQKMRDGFGGGRGMGQAMPMGDDHFPEMIMRRLNLTEEQSSKLDDLRQGQRKEMMELSSKQESLRDKLQDAANKGNKEEVVRIAQEMGKAIGETALLKVAGKENLKTILDDTQLERLEKFNQQRQEKREKMRDMMKQRMGREGARPARGGRGSEGRFQDEGDGWDEEETQRRPRRSR